jgi:hypothetical protein
MVKIHILSLLMVFGMNQNQELKKFILMEWKFLIGQQLKNNSISIL